jgi:hypothetical protein
MLLLGLRGRLAAHLITGASPVPCGSVTLSTPVFTSDSCCDPGVRPSGGIPVTPALHGAMLPVGFSVQMVSPSS